MRLRRDNRFRRFLLVCPPQAEFFVLFIPLWTIFWTEIALFLMNPRWFLRISSIRPPKNLENRPVAPSFRLWTRTPRFTLVWNFLQTRVEVLLSKQNRKYCDRFLDHFLEKSWNFTFFISAVSRSCAVYLVYQDEFGIRRVKGFGRP